MLLSQREVHNDTAIIFDSTYESILACDGQFKVIQNSDNGIVTFSTTQIVVWISQSPLDMILSSSVVFRYYCHIEFCQEIDLI